jgi:predicted NBD/HSP70 family sugar kinase
VTTDTTPAGGQNASPGDLLELVRTGRASTRTELAQATGLSRTAVITRVATLLEAGLLLPGEELASTGGRPPASLVFTREAGVVLAAAVGRSRSQLGVFDLDGRELAGVWSDHEVGIGPDELMPQVASRLKGLLEGVTPRVVAVGMSLAGTVDPAQVMSVDSPVMRGWDGVPLAPYLAEVADAPVHLANDAVALATSELLGQPDPPREALVLKASTGLGIGIISRGDVLHGAAGATGEIGHSKHSAAAGLTCRCGATGCLETVAGGWALVQRLNEQGGSAGHVRDLVRLALEGDPRARGLLLESSRHVGDLLANAVNLLNPWVVVIGGDMAAAFDLYVPGVRQNVYANAAAMNTRDLQFRPAVHGDRAGLVGCAALAIEAVLAPPAVDAWLATRG